MGEYQQTRPARASFDQTLIALADSTRRKILDRLSQGEARVTEVAADFPISLNSVSKHIKILERAQLIERQIMGRDHLLRITPEPLSEVQAWIKRKQVFWAAQLAALDDFLSNESQDEK